MYYVCCLCGPHCKKLAKYPNSTYNNWYDNKYIILILTDKDYLLEFKASLVCVWLCRLHSLTVWCYGLGNTTAYYCATALHFVLCSCNKHCCIERECRNACMSCTCTGRDIIKNLYSSF